MWSKVKNWNNVGKNSRIIPSIWPQTLWVAKVYRGWAISGMEKYQFTMVQFFKNQPLWPLCHLITWRKWYLYEKMSESHFLRPCFFLPHSVISAHHLWILAFPWGLWSNGQYQPIVPTYLISFINFDHIITLTTMTDSRSLIAFFAMLEPETRPKKILILCIFIVLVNLQWKRRRILVDWKDTLFSDL